MLHLDESQRGDVIAIGGFIADAADLSALADQWRRLKRDVFKVAEDLELKYTLNLAHPTRQPLDDAGWPQMLRVPRMLEEIAGMNVRIVADVVYPAARGVNVHNLYLDGLNWCVRRLMNHCDPDDPGPHWVVVDMPPAHGDLENASDRLKELYRNAATAAFDLYQRMYWEPERRAGGGEQPALKDRGFAPELVAGHARHSDLLQIADIVAGCFRDFCHYNLVYAARGVLPAARWEEANMRRIAARIRRHWETRSVRGWGFDLFPHDHAAHAALMNRVDAL